MPKSDVHSPDPLYVVKRQRITELQHLALSGDLTSQAAAHPRSDEPPKPANLIFLDSTDLHLCPDVSPVYVPDREADESRYAGFGESLERTLRQPVFPAGEGLYTIHHRKRAAEFLEHLQLLIDLDPNCFWFVVLDNASAHTTAAIAAFAVQPAPRTTGAGLPSYLQSASQSD